MWPHVPIGKHDCVPMGAHTVHSHHRLPRGMESSVLSLTKDCTLCWGHGWPTKMPPGEAWAVMWGSLSPVSCASITSRYPKAQPSPSSKLVVLGWIICCEIPLPVINTQMVIYTKQEEKKIIIIMLSCEVYFCK